MLFSLSSISSLFPCLNVPCKSFLHGFTMITFGWGVLLNTHRHKHTDRLRAGPQVKSEALQSYSNITGTTGPVNRLFSHTGRERGSTLRTDVSSRSHICIYQIFSDPTPASALRSVLIFTACTWLRWDFTGLLIDIFIWVCIDRADIWLTSIRFLIVWKVCAKKFKQQRLYLSNRYSAIYCPSAVSHKRHIK